MQGHLPVPDLQPVTVQAIVRLGDDTVGVSGRESLQPVAPLASLHITNLVLSDNVAPAVCSKDPLDPLCMSPVCAPPGAALARATGRHCRRSRPVLSSVG